jgi:hypothetical protein
VLLLVQLLQPSSPCALQLHERNLLCLLLAQPPDKDVGKKTPAQLETMWRDGEQQPLPNLVRAGRRAWCTYSMRQHSVASLCSRLLVRPAPRAARRYS